MGRHRHVLLAVKHGKNKTAVCNNVVADKNAAISELHAMEKDIFKKVFCKMQIRIHNSNKFIRGGGRIEKQKVTFAN